MRRSMMIALVALATLAVTRGIARGATPLADMPVGSAATYHIVTRIEGVDPDGGATTTDDVIRIERVSETEIVVHVNGGDAQQLAFADGAASLPNELLVTLGPFLQTAAYVGAAPAPLAAGATWTATVPVIFGGNVDAVPVQVRASPAGATGITVAANGKNQFVATVNAREITSAVSFAGTATFNAANVLLSAKRETAISSHIQAASMRGAGLTKDTSFSWTATLVQP